MRTIHSLVAIGSFIMATAGLGVAQAGAGGAVSDSLSQFLDQSTAAPGTSVTGRAEFRYVTTDPDNAEVRVAVSGTGSAGSNIVATSTTAGLTCTPVQATLPADLVCTFGPTVDPGTFEVRFRLDVASTATPGPFWDVQASAIGFPATTPAELQIVAPPATTTTTTTVPATTTTTVATSPAPTSAAPTSAAPPTTVAAAAEELAVTGSSTETLMTIALAALAFGALALLAARRASRGSGRA